MIDNNELKDILSAIPYSERVVLLPQCLRSNQCKASRKKYGVLVCEECRQCRDDGIECPVPDMISSALEIGYKDVHIFTGGSGIVPFFKEHGLPEAVIAVACEMEIREGIEKMKEIGVPSQVVCLLEDGCAETHFVEDDSDLIARWKKFLTMYPPLEKG